MPAMGWVFALLMVIVVGFVVLAAAGRLGGMGPYLDDRPVPGLPTDRPLTGSDLRDIRFPLVARGYPPAQVDAALDRLATQLEQPAGRFHADRSSGAAAPGALGWPRQA